MGGWNFIALRIPPLFQSPLLLGDLMGKVKARCIQKWKSEIIGKKQMRTMRVK